MSDHAASSYAASPRSTALRVFGTVGGAVIVLAVVAVAVRPDMMMSVVHAVMGMVG